PPAGAPAQPPTEDAAAADRRRDHHARSGAAPDRRAPKPVRRRARHGVHHSSSAIRGASRLKIHAETTQTATKMAIGASSGATPPAALTGPGALGSTIQTRTSSKSGASGLSMITCRNVAGTTSMGYRTGVA